MSHNLISVTEIDASITRTWCMACGHTGWVGMGRVERWLPTHGPGPARNRPACRLQSFFTATRERRRERTNKFVSILSTLKVLGHLFQKIGILVALAAGILENQDTDTHPRDFERKGSTIKKLYAVMERRRQNKSNT